MSIEQIVQNYTAFGDTRGTISTDSRTAGGPRSDPSAGGRGDQRPPADLCLLRKRAAHDPAMGPVCPGGFLSGQHRLSVGTDRPAGTPAVNDKNPAASAAGFVLSVCGEALRTAAVRPDADGGRRGPVLPGPWSAASGRRG